jgi:hypothetical protein
LFRLKITSSKRGALAGTRCAHFSCENKKRASQPSLEVHEKTNSKPRKPRSTKSLLEEATTYNFLGPLVGENREKSRRRPRIGRLLNRMRHATLDLVRRREDQRSHSPRLGSSVDRHLAETERPSPERHNFSGVLLPDDGRQRDPGSSEVLQHRPVLLEHFLLLSLQGAMGPVRPRLPDGILGECR